MFGFPCTTAAGMEALSLLSAHDFSVALNTARSAAEVKDYCKAYSLTGGVAEHGSYLWDAVRQRERVLISAETARQLEELRRHLQGIPGVFLDERHQYSIRAFTYRKKPPGLIQSLLSSAHSSSIGDGALAPISTHILYQLLVDLRLDRLTFHHTTIDTTIVAKEADKGTGLAALRDWVLAGQCRDDRRRRHRARSANVSRGHPQFRPFQYRLQTSGAASRMPDRLVILISEVCSKLYVRSYIRTNEHRANSIPSGETPTHRDDDLFMTVLQAADQTWTTNLLRAMFNPAAFRIFIR